MKNNLFHDIIEIAGCGLVVYGIWQMYPPLAFVGVGGIIVFVSARLRPVEG